MMAILMALNLNIFYFLKYLPNFVCPTLQTNFVHPSQKLHNPPDPSAYCGDKFPDMATRAAHERSTHIDKEGKLFGIICDREDCQEKLPNSKEFRRHMIDKHRKNNYSLVKKESFCCDLCGKTFKVCKYLLYIQGIQF